MRRRSRAIARGRLACGMFGKRARASPLRLRGLLAPVFLACGLGLQGCDGLGQPERERARARVTADAATTVEIVTSTQFNVISLDGGPDGGPQVDLLASDSVVEAPPWDETFDISDTRRFYIRVSAVDTASVTGRLEVFIDGELRANLTTDLQEKPLVNLFLQQR